MIQKLEDSRAVLLGAAAIFALGLTTSGYALGDGLRRIKLAERNARRCTGQFASDGGVSVAKMKTACQACFSVGARDGENCGNCGSSGGSSPFQKVRVVTTIDYDLG